MKHLTHTQYLFFVCPSWLQHSPLLKQYPVSLMQRASLSDWQTRGFSLSLDSSGTWCRFSIRTNWGMSNDSNGLLTWDLPCNKENNKSKTDIGYIRQLVNMHGYKQGSNWRGLEDWTLSTFQPPILVKLWTPTELLLGRPPPHSWQF